MRADQNPVVAEHRLALDDTAAWCHQRVLTMAVMHNPSNGENLDEPSIAPVASRRMHPM